jgi:hypothetical protein
MDVLALWLPILVSAVAVFIASSIAWTVLPHHNADIKPLPDERGFLERLKEFNIPPGLYMWPHCADSKEMKSEAFKERYRQGPWGTLNVAPAQPSMVKNMSLLLLVCLLVSLFVGYLTSMAQPAQTGEFLGVFRVAGAAGVLGYCFGGLPTAIFMGKPTRFIMTELIDSIVYGLLTGLVFALLWPAAATPVA